MTSEVADPAEAVAVAPSADPGFLQRHGATIEYILIPGAALAGALVVFGHFCRAVRQESARPVFLHVPGRVRHLVLLAEHADPRRAVDPDRAVHGAAGAARHGDHRRRRRAVDRRAVGDFDRADRCNGPRRWRSNWRWRRPAWSAAGSGFCCRAACGNIAASTKRYRACCWSISRSRSSIIWSRA